jgi:hypothetical protein
MERSQRSGKEGMLEYLCMYMPSMVSSGTSVMILYPRESYYSLADLEGLLSMFCQSTTW